MAKRCYVLKEDAQNLVKLRRSKNLTQADVAGKLEISISKLCRWEKSVGERLISLTDVKKLENFYGEKIFADLGKDPDSALIKRIAELEEENRKLKELLIQKWS